MTERNRDKLAGILLARKGTAAPIEPPRVEGDPRRSPPPMMFWMLPIAMVAFVVVLDWFVGCGVWPVDKPTASRLVTATTQTDEARTDTPGVEPEAGSVGSLAAIDTVETPDRAVHARPPKLTRPMTKSTGDPLPLPPPQAEQVKSSDDAVTRSVRSIIENAKKTPQRRVAKSRHRVQLVAMRSAAAARRQWRTLRRTHEDLFRGLRMTPVKAPPDGGGARLYRLQAGPLRTRTAALRLCRKARQRRLQCLVVGP